MYEEEIMAIVVMSIIPICGVCCFLAYCKENFCQKRKIPEVNNYNEIV
jgi:hypothetical protein